MNLAWDVARAGGLVAWALATASVVWGLVLSTRLARRRPWPAWFLDAHRSLAALAVVFTGVHVLAILLDGFTDFGLADVLVPFAAAWHPVAVAWGIVALYLLVAVEVTSLLRGRMSRRWWRRIHLGSFALFVVATVHAVTAGTDVATTAALGAIVVGVLPVAALAAIRLGRVRPSRAAASGPAQPPRPDAGGVTPVAQ